MVFIKRAFFLFGFFLLILFFCTAFLNASNAEETEYITFDDVEIDPRIPADGLIETTPVIQITFSGLTGGEEGEGENYTLCTGSKDCLDEGSEGEVSLKENFQKSDNDGNLTFTACGDGSKKIKTKCSLEKEKDGTYKDYFHGGSTYYISIGHVEDNKYIPVNSVSIFFKREKPQVIVTHANRSITIELWQEFLRSGGKKRNNYQLVVEGGESNKTYERCINIASAGVAGKKIEEFKDLFAGDYVVKINERNDEGRIGNSCAGGYTFFHFNCSLTAKGTDTKCSAPVEDPNGAELKELNKYLEVLNVKGVNRPFPCGQDGTGTDRTPQKTPAINPAEDCVYINTAIGQINITREGFVKSIFGFVLMIATFAAIVIIIYSGYLFMVSQGDKEKLAGARETITSAIVGLLFIVLSVLILEIIGVDILQIPGFTRK